MLTPITDELLTYLGFKRERVWRQKDNNYTLKYSIEGFDGQIDLYAQYSMPGQIQPIPRFKDGEFTYDHLLKYCQAPYHVYGGNFHIVSIDTEVELHNLITALKIATTDLN